MEPEITEALLAEIRGEMREGFAELRGSINTLTALSEHRRETDTQQIVVAADLAKAAHRRIDEHAQILAHWRGWIAGSSTIAGTVGAGIALVVSWLVSSVG